MSSGMLMGINQGCYEVQDIEDGDYHIKFILKNKTDGYLWALLSVYGAAQEEHKEHFLSELVRACTSCGDLPFIVGGYFNIIRNPFEKNNSRYENKWPLLFNAIIETLNLKELEMSGRKCTWANYAEVPTYEKLDHILVTTDWEQKFPLASVQALTREISDHTPLLLDTGEPSRRGNTRNFRFELAWRREMVFFELVKEVWESKNRVGSPLEKWQNKIRRLRRFLRGWARNLSSQNKNLI
jgi:hypothetical protein